jgi:hypothetical protein
VAEESDHMFHVKDRCPPDRDGESVHQTGRVPKNVVEGKTSGRRSL